MRELFKVISFSPDYAVSNMGRVKRITPKKRDFGKNGVFLNGRLDRGWRYVCLQLPGKKEKAFRVHRLVMNEFSHVSKLGINHINGIKDDNRLENLEYATPKENSAHAVRTGLINFKCENNPNGRFKINQILDIVKMLDSGIPQPLIAEKYKCFQSHISKINRGEIWNSLTKRKINIHT